MNSVILMVRGGATREWINNFMGGGWKVKDDEGNWIRMTPENTQVRSPMYDVSTTYKQWLEIVEEHGV